MADRTKELLSAYARANGFAVGADFKARKKTYSKEGTTLTEDEILGSKGFAGFCDGYQGRPHMYKGPQGSPEQIGIGARILNSLVEVEHMMPDSVKAQFQESLDEAKSSNQYDFQYNLGRSFSKR